MDSVATGRLPIAPEILARVRSVELRARRAIREGLGGRFASAVRGSGVEFAEVREYVAGDDARTVDWNVTARSGRLQVKRFDEEREQTLFFLFDSSRSCRVGAIGAAFRQTALDAAALLGLAAAESGDRVGAAIGGARLERLLAPRHGRNGCLALLAEWLDAPEAPRGAPGDALAEWLRLRTRPCLLVWISDFHVLPERALLAAAARRHDVVCVSVRPAWLESPPESGLVRFEDPESGARRLIDLASKRVRGEWIARVTAQRDALRERARSAGADLVELGSGASVVAPLLRLLHRREAAHR